MKNRIALTLERGNKQPVSFSVFNDSANKLYDLLSSAQRRSGETRISWSVAELSIGSAHVGLVPEIDVAELALINDVMNLAESLNDGAEPTSLLMWNEVNHLCGLSELTARENDPYEVVLKGAERAVPLTPKAYFTAHKWLNFRPEYEDLASLEGYLQMVTVRSRNQCHIYQVDPRGRETRVRCTFDEALLDKVRGAVGEHILASARVRYDRQGQIQEASITDLEVMGSDDPPSIDEFAKVNLLDGLSPEDHVRILRDEG